MIPLNMIKNGEARIVKINGGKIFKKRLGAIGLREDDIISVVSASFWGPVILRINGTRIGIGAGMANKIFVEPLRK